MNGRFFEVPTRLELPIESIARLCDEYAVKELALFGSVLSDQFGPSSDIDFLVRFSDDDAGPWMSRLTGLQAGLAHLLGRSVDVMDWRGVERSRNPFRRRSILAGSKLLYAA